MPARRVPSFESAVQNAYWRQDDARAVLSALESSGKSLSAFCRLHDLKPSRLARWRKVLEPKTNSEEVRAADFVELRVVAAPVVADSSKLEVVLGGDRRIVVGREFDADTLARLVQVLESVPC